MRTKILFIGSVLAAFCLSVPIHSATAEEAWLEVAAAAQAASAVAAQEESATGAARRQLHAERVSRFLEAESLLKSYIGNWLKEKESIQYLRAICGLGVMRENARLLPQALATYRFCLEHREIANPQAIYQNRPIREVATAGIARTTESQPSTPLLSFIVFRHMKGAIDNVQHFKEAPAPYSMEEEFDLAFRFCSSSETNRAVELGTQILDQARIRSEVYVSPSLVLFGMDGRPADAQSFGRVVEDQYSHLHRELVGAAVPEHLLVVYANLGTEGEAAGEKLSQAVHGRAMHHAEGYYQPLDNSLVLRKNLRRNGEGPLVQGDWFAGTALHELVHAVITRDFPTAPIWLNEGLAALHEEQNSSGPIDNYRLYYLLAGLRQEKMPTVEYLLRSDEEHWIPAYQPVMAAAARYFCMFLSEKHSLTPQKLYREIKAQVESDRVKSFEQATGLKADRLDEEFRDYVRSRPIGVVNDIWQRAQPNIDSFVERMESLPADGLKRQSAP